MSDIEVRRDEISRQNHVWIPIGRKDSEGMEVHLGDTVRWIEDGHVLQDVVQIFEGDIVGIPEDQLFDVVESPGLRCKVIAENRKVVP